MQIYPTPIGWRVCKNCFSIKFLTLHLNPMDGGIWKNEILYADLNIWCTFYQNIFSEIPIDPFMGVGAAKPELCAVLGI